MKALITGGAYRAEKAGMFQLAFELAPNIRANAIAPGLVLLPDDYRGKKKIPLLVSEDVAHAVKYLISARYLTGQVIMVDGGEHLGVSNQ